MEATAKTAQIRTVAAHLPRELTQQLAIYWEKLQIAIETVSSWREAASLPPEVTFVTNRAMLQRCPSGLRPSIEQRTRLLMVVDRQERSNVPEIAGIFLRQTTRLALMGIDAPFLSPPPIQPTEQPSHNLTDREFDTLKGMAQGKSMKEIGVDIGLSENTVKTHTRQVFRKLGARERAQAVAIGFRRGILR